MSNKDRTQLPEKVLTGLRKALRKLVESSADNNESLVIADKDGNIKIVPAKELMILYDREIYKRKKELDQALNSYNKISINAFYFLSEDETSSLILYSSY